MWSWYILMGNANMEEMLLTVVSPSLVAHLL